MATAALAQGSIPMETCQLYFEQEGHKDRPAVLCIHGLGGTTNFYQPVVSAIEDYNVVRFDLSGHGRSTLPSKNTSISSYVEDAEAVIKHLGLKDVTVAGHSMGGLIALHLAAKLPEIVKRLVLFGPVKAPPEAGQKNLRARAKTSPEGYAQACEALAGSPDPEWDEIIAEATILGGADAKVSPGLLLDSLNDNLANAGKVTRETWENSSPSPLSILRSL
ncbi:hypothetical protein DTO027B9_6206 [Paecilomyces variotii]|nr:hypothetical protein DTO027B9_6206 [Paecilomyces variotii]